ncbi:MAG TPA: TonB-dependent receptor, partial [Opitutaceae bacterium]|nr:TonB-dependent receptor [Opitutaceae bacterium]
MLQPFSFFSASSRYTRWLQRIGLFAIAFISSAGSYGQTTDDGSISGRVFSSRSGGNLERVRVTVEGRQNETFTDAAGRFQLGNVPVGPARVKVFRTGLIEQTVTAHVIAGKDVSIDIEMSGYDAAGRTDPAVVNLDRFEVKTSREMDGAAIAINEQRFAPNMRNVINAGEFGPTDEGNIGELLRFVPGVTIFTSVGNAYSASINGVPDAYVPVTVRGFNLASPQEETSRMTMLQNMSTNNLSRIEVVYSPTPESPGMALAGSVNVVPQSSFERSKPSFTSSAFIMMRSDDRSFHKTPGPGKDPSRKVHPGMSFSYIAPVNDRFGFTLSGGTSTQYLRAEYLGTTWVGVGAASNGTTLPDTTPDRPYLTGYSNSSSNTETSRYSLGASIDYKLSARDRISFSLQYVLHTAQYNEKALAFATGGVLPDFTPTST